MQDSTLTDFSPEERSEINKDALQYAEQNSGTVGSIFSRVFVQVHELLEELKSLDKKKANRIESVMHEFTQCILHARNFDFIANAHIVQELTGVTASNLYYYRENLLEEGRHYMQRGKRYYYSNAVVVFLYERERLLKERLKEMRTVAELEAQSAGGSHV